MQEPPNPAHLRIKVGTAVATAALAGALLLFDWDSAAGGGHQTVFSGVRPTLKAYLNRLYNRKPAGQPRQQQQQGSDSSKD